MKDTTLALNAPQSALLKLMSAGKPLRTAAAELGMRNATAGMQIAHARKRNGLRTDQELLLHYCMEQARR